MTTEHGNGQLARQTEILRTVVGSGVHGIAIEGTDDHDEMGLLPLFAPEESIVVVTPLSRQLRSHADVILSRRAVRRFLGYMHAQRERMVGNGKQNRVPHRPELVAAYGYDVKYASHALLLAYQGLEVTEHGRL